MNKSILGIFSALLVIFLGANAAAVDYTAAQVAVHSTNADCFVIVNSAVYDLTAVVAWHPNVINCGADNTQTYLARHNTLGNIAPYQVGNLITVVPDTTAPIITMLGANPASVTQNNAYTDAGATATDNIDGTISVQKTGTVNTATIGTYTITYTATDAAGNTATKTRTVNVIAAVPVPDTTAPVITMLGANPASVTQNNAYTDAGATATDNIDGTISVQKTGTVNTATIGTYTITYTATDAAGNTATKTRTVNVIAAVPVPDTTAPIITMLGANPASVTQNNAYTDAGATATDNIDGTISVQKTGTVNTATIGTYTITYTATDAAGNTATKTRTVNVVAQAPSLPPTPANKTYTPKQIAKHDATGDCWVYVFNKVYDVTPVMADYADFYICGQNNTAKWQASMFGNDTSIMNPFLIGQVKTAKLKIETPDKQDKENGREDDRKDSQKDERKNESGEKDNRNNSQSPGRSNSHIINESDD